jgi:outer membrane protein assembly factor BamA
VIELVHTEILEQEEGGVLEQERIAGAENHGLLGVGLAAIWDTRNSPVFPRSGAFHYVAFTGYRSYHGPARWLAREEADFRLYLPLQVASVFALRVRVRASSGDVPFSMYSPVGGIEGGLRGIYGTRYIERAAAIAVAEFRFPLFWRFGCVIFGGTGEVAPSFRDLSLGGVHHTGGVGVRFALLPDSRMNVGIDLAFGEGETNVYFVLGEVF